MPNVLLTSPKRGNPDCMHQIAESRVGQHGHMSCEGARTQEYLRKQWNNVEPTWCGIHCCSFYPLMTSVYISEVVTFPPSISWTMSGSGVYIGLLWCLTYWVEWKVLKASPLRKSRGCISPATGRICSRNQTSAILLISMSCTSCQQ